MASAEIDVIAHLLEVEKEAATLVLDAQKKADEKIADARFKADEEFRERYSLVLSGIEKEFEQKKKDVEKKCAADLESYEAELKAAAKDEDAFFAQMDAILFS